MRMKRIATTTGTLSAVATGIVALVASLLTFAVASPASAGEDTYKGCRPGNVCLYSGDLSEDFLDYQGPGLVPDGKKFWVIVNNGHSDPGRDHVRFDWRHTDSSTWHSECLHYRDGSGGSGYKFDLRDGPTGGVIKNMSWGGEC